MPGPLIRDPRQYTWQQPDTESVLDSPMTKALRILAGITGLSDPQSQILGLMAPMETGPVGGLVGAGLDCEAHA